MQEEIWKDIKGYEGLYQISNFGNTASIRYGFRKLSQSVKKNGYWKVSLYKNKSVNYFHVHRLVALNFLDEVLGMNEINHKDGNKSNNCVSNLECSNRSLNNKHSYQKLNRISTFKGKVGFLNIRSIPVVLVSILNSERFYFHSHTLAGKYIGVKSSRISEAYKTKKRKIKSYIVDKPNLQDVCKL